MDKLDQMIEAALAEEDRAIVEETRELGFFTQFTRQLQGPNAWVSWMSTVAIFVYVALALWCGYEFFTATEPLAAIKWGLGAAVSVMVIGLFKLFMFGEMQANRIIRELKRVELILAAREK